jgi:hypothetical protein
MARTKQPAAATCDWSESGDGEYWEGSCGVAWTLTDGTPTDNEMHFCPRCGLRLREAGRSVPDRAGDAQAEIRRLSEALDAEHRSNALMGDLLRRTCDALKGPHPDPLTLHSFHDLPEAAAALVECLPAQGRAPAGDYRSYAIRQLVCAKAKEAAAPASAAMHEECAVFALCMGRVPESGEVLRWLEAAADYKKLVSEFEENHGAELLALRHLVASGQRRGKGGAS